MTQNNVTTHHVATMASLPLLQLIQATQLQERVARLHRNNHSTTTTPAADITSGTYSNTSPATTIHTNNNDNIHASTSTTMYASTSLHHIISLTKLKEKSTNTNTPTTVHNKQSSSKTNGYHCHKNDAIITAMINKRNDKKKSGVIHWTRYRYPRDPIMSLDEDITRELERFVVHLMLDAPGVNKYSTVKNYLSHVTTHHTAHDIKHGTEAMRGWPSIHNKALNMVKALAKQYFIDMDDSENGGRLPMTAGLLNFLVIGENGRGGIWNANTYLGKRMLISELTCMFAGSRRGELHPLIKNRTIRKTKRDCLKESITIGSNEIQVMVFDKAAQKMKPISILRHEVQPMIHKYGNHFDIFALYKEIMSETNNKGHGLLLENKDGSPITYQEYWKFLTKTCASAGIPKGRIGGHSGRIRMATLLAMQGHKVKYIKMRGRWSSECWEIYVRTFSLPASRSITSFRLGELNVCLKGFPDASEFRK